MSTPNYTRPAYMALWDTTLEYLRNIKPELYRQLRRDKTLDEYIDGRIVACEQYAESLIEGGEYENIAWHRAVRSQILESEEG